MMLKGAIHVHTTCSDGSLTPEEALRVYRDLGFDFVALTDHDFLMKPGAYAGVPDEFEGMLVFKGVEKTVFDQGYVHISHVFGEQEVLRVLNHPAEYACDVAEIVSRLGRIGRDLPIDAVEVTQNGFYTPEYDTDAIPRPKVAADDAHTREGCGRAWIEIECEKDKDAILRAIRNGAARVCYNGTAHQSAWLGTGGNGGG